MLHLQVVINSSQTVTFNSSLGAGLPIPDGPATAGVPVPGINTALSVSGIPVGATILDISVKLNITHPYAGDMIVSLKSPTSTATTGIINLFALLNGGNGTNATANFTNTVISSNGITALSGAPAPRTGTFKADAYITTSPPLTIALPSNGGAANVNNWSTLLSTPNANGNWVLYLADAGATDIGTLLDGV
jgi:subtilisin-like proprotein convertase family protein